MKQIILLVFLLLSPITYADTDERDSFFDGTKIIHLTFTDLIDNKYIVNVLWMPDDGLVPRLVGPAIISFTKDGGYSFPILADAFHLPFDLLTKLGILKFDEDSSDGHTAAVDLTKVYSVKYDSLGEVGLFDNSHHYDESRLGTTPFFFEDIDFDGKDELVVVNFKAGQRWVDSYTIYQPTYKNGYMYNLATTSPFSSLDQKATFNKEKRTIDVFSSGGACGSTNEKFQLVDGKFTPVEFVEWVIVENDEKIACIESIYTVIDEKRILKSKSDSYGNFFSNGYGGGFFVGGEDYSQVVSGTAIYVK